MARLRLVHILVGGKKRIFFAEKKPNIFLIFSQHVKSWKFMEVLGSSASGTKWPNHSLIEEFQEPLNSAEVYTVSNCIMVLSMTVWTTSNLPDLVSSTRKSSQSSQSSCPFYFFVIQNSVVALVIELLYCSLSWFWLSNMQFLCIRH